MENLSIEFQPTVKEIEKEVIKALKLQKWSQIKAKRVYNKAVSLLSIKVINILFYTTQYISNLFNIFGG